MFLTETGLDSKTGNAVLNESAPPNLCQKHGKNKKGGGVCALFRDNIATHMPSLWAFSSFEYVSLKMELKRFHFRLSGRWRVLQPLLSGSILNDWCVLWITEVLNPIQLVFFFLDNSH